MPFNSLMKKSLVVGIVLLFVGTSILSSASVTKEKPSEDSAESMLLQTIPYSNAWFLCDVTTDTLWKLTDHGSINLGEAPGVNGLAGGTWIPDDEYPWWAAEHWGSGTGSALWKINAEGDYELVTVNCGAKLTGLEFDPVTGLLYGCSVDALYTIEMVTGAATLVGMMPGLFIAMGISAEGQGYGIDYVGDRLFRINLSDASTVLIGSLGININYAQDCAFDYEAGPEVFYLMAYTSGPMLYICDIETGACTLVGPITFGEVTAFAISYANQYPVADFTWTPATPQSGETIFFNASTSYDPNGSIQWYDWDWNNDGVYEESSSNPSTSHSWLFGGEIPVTLAVWDYLGGSATKTKIITVSGSNPPIINGPSWGIINTDYTFCFTWTDPDADEFYCLWDWGDGTITEWLGPYSSGQTICANHSWSQKGTYEIFLKLKDMYGVEIVFGPYIFHVYDVKKAFIYGRYTNQTEDGDYIAIEAVNLRLIYLDPFQFLHYKEKETITYLNNTMKGLVLPRFLIGLLDVLV
jgi:hypothetical protein